MKIKSSETYVAQGAAYCPVCGSDDLRAGDTEYPSTREIVQQITCGSCGSHWNELYKLHSYADLEVGDTGVFAGAVTRNLTEEEQKAFDSIFPEKDEV